MNLPHSGDKSISEADIRRKLFQFLIVSYISAPASSTTKFSMMPLAPTMTELPAAHKPKIGFSIDSIVGGGSDDAGTKERARRASSVEKSQCSTSPIPDEPSSPSENGTSNMFQRRASGVTSPLEHLQKYHLHHRLLLSNDNKGSISPPMQMLLPNHHHPLQQLRLPFMHHPQLPERRSPTGASHSPGRVSPHSPDNDNTNNSINSSISRGVNNITGGGVTNQTATSSSVNSNPSSRSPSPQVSDSPKGTLTTDTPSSPHEIHHPLVTGSHGPRPGMPGGIPPSHGPVGPHGLPQFAAYPPGMLNFAAVAAAAAQGHPIPPPGLPGWMPPPHAAQHHPHPAAAAHPLYPWLLAKHSRLFPHRFGPGPDLPGFLFQPFRKPKRIRTAFSPSQLLKLEHAFEKNHYVVGAERKQLAKSLSLSETQVKVWFQNRRTKHKRVEQEEDSIKKSDGTRTSGNNNSGSDPPSSGSNFSSSAISADSSTRNYSETMSDDDEEIVMDDEYSDDEEMSHSHGQSMHHLRNTYS